MKRSFRNFIHSIIREYKTFEDGVYSVDINQLYLYDKKLFLSHFLDANEYEYVMKSDHRVDVNFREYASYFQELIEDEIPSVFSDDMYEAGRHSVVDQINGETSWI